MSASGLSLVRCPFCEYAEWTTAAEPTPSASELHVVRTLMAAGVLGAVLLSLFFGDLLAAAALFVLFSYMTEGLRDLKKKKKERPVERRPDFVCRSKSCGRVSCRECRAECHAPEPCRDTAPVCEGTLDGLRLHVQEAISASILRVCPKCNVSFEKKEGCNKVVCPCGMAVCYICRRDVSEEKYEHFCQHFKDTPGMPCRTCTKCELFRETDAEDEELAQKAGQEACDEYVQKYPQVARMLTTSQGKKALRGILNPRRSQWPFG